MYVYCSAFGLIICAIVVSAFVSNLQMAAKLKKMATLKQTERPMLKWPYLNMPWFDSEMCTLSESRPGHGAWQGPPWSGTLYDGIKLYYSVRGGLIAPWRGEPKVKFQKVLGFYDVSRLFIRVRNYCTTAGHNYSINADMVRAVMHVCPPRLVGKVKGVLVFVFLGVKSE